MSISSNSVESKLNDDSWEIINPFLSPEDILTCAQVSKFFYKKMQIRVSSDEDFLRNKKITYLERARLEVHEKESKFPLVWRKAFAAGGLPIYERVNEARDGITFSLTNQLIGDEKVITLFLVKNQLGVCENSSFFPKKYILSPGSSRGFLSPEFLLRLLQNQDTIYKIVELSQKGQEQKQKAEIEQLIKPILADYSNLVRLFRVNILFNQTMNLACLVGLAAYIVFIYRGIMGGD